MMSQDINKAAPTMIDQLTRPSAKKSTRRGTNAPTKNPILTTTKTIPLTPFPGCFSLIPDLSGDGDGGT
jgi:hypothetical protein